jgi:hypothetical protein
MIDYENKVLKVQVNNSTNINGERVVELIVTPRNFIRRG